MFEQLFIFILCLSSSDLLSLNATMYNVDDRPNDRKYPPVICHSVMEAYDYNKKNSLSSIENQLNANHHVRHRRTPYNNIGYRFFESKSLKCNRNWFSQLCVYSTDNRKANKIHTCKQSIYT